MLKKILIANRGDQPRSGAAPKPRAAEADCMARAACTGGFDAEVAHV